MVLTLMPIIIISCFCILVYFLFQMNRQLAKWKKILASSETQLKKEIEQKKILIEQLEEVKDNQNREVLYDPLTKLPARRVFEDRLTQILHQSKRNHLTFAVMSLDIDGFKVINDALGQDAGDQLLKEISTRLQGMIRTVDTVSRLSGDEFAFILSQLSKPETAAYVAQRLLNAVSEPFNIEDQEVFLTASIGISVFPNDSDDLKELMKNSDIAMHQAKARGRNMYQFYRSEMRMLSQRELLLTSSLQNSEIYNDLVVYFQPIMDIQNKKLISMEALLFWQHPDFGLIKLQDFLKLAEDNGKILEIGEWFLKESLQQFSNWQAEGLNINSIATFVSPRQLENPRFAYKISQLIDDMNLEPGHLSIEISETTLPTKIELIERMFNMLKHIGVQIGLKDFGMGQLSLQHLKRLPIDYVKIASSLIQDITINKDNESIVKMITALGNSSQITVVAEAVETDKQKELLKELGCRIMQGDLFCPPLQMQEFSLEMIASINDKMKTEH